jgi:hypothetical protein
MPSDPQQRKLLRQEIAQLLAKKAIEPVTDGSPGFQSSLFVIPKRNGGYRPVFNLKRLNQHLDAPHFKMETLKQVTPLIQQHDYLTSIDLSDAFLYILVHKVSRKYLRFRWESQTFQFRTTPFGLSTVPWLFTRVTKPVLTWARTQGIRVSAYLDDWIVVADSYQNSLQHTSQLTKMMTKLGWMINWKKSSLDPTQSLEHLGFILNSKEMTFSLPGKKIRDIRKSIRSVIQRTKVSPRIIHSLTMRICAAAMAIFPTNMYTQALMFFKNRSVRRQHHWDQEVTLPQDARQELQWWQENLSKWNGRALLNPDPNKTIYVDASNAGWGGVGMGKSVQGVWSHDEVCESINWRELKAIELTLQSFRWLKNSTILVRSDNTAATTYINKQGGIRSHSLSRLATSIWEMCLKRGLLLQARHIPVYLNTEEDSASRQFQAKNMWQIRPSTYRTIVQTHFGKNDLRIEPLTFYQSMSLGRGILKRWRRTLLPFRGRSSVAP